MLERVTTRLLRCLVDLASACRFDYQQCINGKILAILLQILHIIGDLISDGKVLRGAARILRPHPFGGTLEGKLQRKTQKCTRLRGGDGIVCGHVALFITDWNQSRALTSYHDRNSCVHKGEQLGKEKDITESRKSCIGG